MQNLFLEHLSVVNYKNIEAVDYVLNPKINCFVGRNGVGKTNMLDAVYHLAFGKSYFSSLNNQNIAHHADFCMIEGLFEKENKQVRIQSSLQRDGKKTLKKNNKTYKKIADHLGFIPVVIISPTDRDLIAEGSSTRRKFLDSIIGQTHKSYVHQLVQYQRTLSQRNALLKQFKMQGNFDRETLSVYNDQLVSFGKPIYQKRKAFVEEFLPYFFKRYAGISGSQEKVNLVYESQLQDDDFEELLEESLERDRILQHTSVGPHKDDLQFQIDGYPIKKYGSQGQQKTFLIALKLAQYDMMQHQTQLPPILLLDDIFDKLDDQRVAHIVDLVHDESFGQLFISDTHKERTEEIIKKTGQSYSIFTLNKTDE